VSHQLPCDRLPTGFRYPEILTRVLSLNLVELEPWWFLEDEPLMRTRKGLLSRYPDHDYVPFAYRQDNDDIACWDRSPEDGVVIVHDFASPGCEVNERLESFEAWFRRAIDDMLEW
jgi:hypothetical protein